MHRTILYLIQEAKSTDFSARSLVVNGEKKSLVYANRGAWQATVHGVAKSQT